VGKPGSALTEAAIRKHCAGFLPPPKLPKQVFIVSDLPKSDRGKVLREKLREDYARMKVSA
jgi:acyl-CoA synthetase (AMP-forming)/AMP-acid ligase II